MKVLLLMTSFWWTMTCFAAERSLSRDPSALSYDYGVGVGIGAGTPSGISGLMNWDRHGYLQGVFSYSSGDLFVTGDYIYELSSLMKADFLLRPYVGLGAVLSRSDHLDSLVSDSDGSVHLGARFPLGAYILLREVPLQIYTELVPGLQVISDFQATFALMVGARWLFR